MKNKIALINFPDDFEISEESEVCLFYDVVTFGKIKEFILCQYHHIIVYNKTSEFRTDEYNFYRKIATVNSDSIKSIINNPLEYFDAAVGRERLVNPRQFDNKKDFFAYPKSFKKDKAILERLKVTYLYKPSYSDIYNFKTKNKIFLHPFSKKLCGKFRVNHFYGVVDVVNRFIEIIKPKKIFLGNKDFQQLFLVKKHIQKNGINTKVISCRTIRNKKFIAYSSRLKRLKKYENKKLVEIITILNDYKKKLIRKRIRHNFNYIKNKLLSAGAKKVDYVEIINLKSLKKPKVFGNNCNLFFAFYIKNVRFIDNF